MDDVGKTVREGGVREGWSVVGVVRRDCSFDDIERWRGEEGGRQKAEDFEFWVIGRGEN